MLRLVTREPSGPVSGAGWADVERLRKQNIPHWLDLSGFTDDALEQMRAIYDFHPLTIDDCRDFSHRAKVKEYGHFSFLVVPLIRPGAKRPPGELDIFLGQNYLVTVHRDPVAVIDRIQGQNGRARESLCRGADFLLYDILDVIIDDYYPALDAIDRSIGMSEREIFTGSGERVLDKLLSLKREVLQARRMLGPLRDTMNVVVRRDFPNIRPECRIYFLDLYDHLIRLFDICDTQRELLSSAMEAHLSQVSNRLNEVMKVLTIMSTILMPMTLISGIYGMNFRFMPELNWRFGYPWALGLMLTVSLLMLAYFRRRKWL